MIVFKIFSFSSISEHEIYYDVYTYLLWCIKGEDFILFILIGILSARVKTFVTEYFIPKMITSLADVW